MGSSSNFSCPTSDPALWQCMGRQQNIAQVLGPLPDLKGVSNSWLHTSKMSFFLSYSAFLSKKRLNSCKRSGYQTLEYISNLEGLLRYKLWDSTARASHIMGLGWVWKFAIQTSYPQDIDAAGLNIPSWELLYHWKHWRMQVRNMTVHVLFESMLTSVK